MHHFLGKVVIVETAAERLGDAPCLLEIVTLNMEVPAALSGIARLRLRTRGKLETD
jgi:hypothetical protein